MGRRSDLYIHLGQSKPGRVHRQRKECALDAPPKKGSPIIVDGGDSVRIHLVNGGYMSHPMHIHTHRFQRVEKDGGTVPEATRHDMDVTNVAPAERHTIESTADADPESISCTAARSTTS